MYKVGIIGRPNVGKSTLFNRLAGRRVAIVDDMPGVTRDRIEVVTEWNGRSFTLVDTAGFDLKEEMMKKQMQDQFYASLDSADIFIVMTDGEAGVHSLDEIVCRILRERGKKFIVAVNKIDSEARENLVYEFYSLGVETLMPLSATHGRYVDDLLDILVEQIPEDEEFVDPYEGRIKIVVTGRPNVGKSSLINRWLNEDRLIVSPVPGTTRDAVDTFFEYEGEEYVLIDTAGIRKKSVMFKDKIEKYGYFRWQDAVERADIAVCLIDGEMGLTDRDIKVIADAWEGGRPVVLVVNKWDLVEEKDDFSKELRKDIDFHLKFLNNPPIIFTSAVTGKNAYKIFDAVKLLYKEYTKRVNTATLNKLLEDAQARHQPPVIRNRRLKMYYMTQVYTSPPSFVIFVNYPDNVHFSYQRFIVNMIREYFGFGGVPVRLFLRKKGEKTEVEEV